METGHKPRTCGRCRRQLFPYPPLSREGLKGDDLLDICPSCNGLLVFRDGKWVPHD